MRRHVDQPLVPDGFPGAAHQIAVNELCRQGVVGEDIEVLPRLNEELVYRYRRLLGGVASIRNDPTTAATIKSAIM